MWGNLLYSFRFLCFKRVLRGYRQKLTTHLIYQQQRIHTTCSKTRKEDSIFYEGIPSQWCNILDVRQFVVRWAHRTTTNEREEDENANSLGKWDHVIIVIPNGIPFTQTAFSGRFAWMVSERHVPVTVDLHGRRLEIKKVYLAAILRRQRPLLLRRFTAGVHEILSNFPRKKKSIYFCGVYLAKIIDITSTDSWKLRRHMLGNSGGLHCFNAVHLESCLICFDKFSRWIHMILVYNSMFRKERHFRILFRTTSLTTSSFCWQLVTQNVLPYRSDINILFRESATVA